MIKTEQHVRNLDLSTENGNSSRFIPVPEKQHPRKSVSSGLRFNQGRQTLVASKFHSAKHFDHDNEQAYYKSIPFDYKKDFLRNWINTDFMKVVEENEELIHSLFQVIHYFTVQYEELKRTELGIDQRQKENEKQKQA